MRTIYRACLWVIICGVIAGGAGPAAALPVISELMYDGIGTDAETVFTELFGTAGYDLTGWSLVGVNGADGGAYRTIDLTGAVIPADGILVVATSTAIGQVLAARDFIGSVDWQNGPDAVWLVNPDGLTVDALQYGDAGPYNAGEGTPATDVAAGQSLARDFMLTDTNDNFADFAVMDAPTPGSLADSMPQPVPEPGTIAMLGLGLAGLGGWGQRRRMQLRAATDRMGSPR